LASTPPERRGAARDDDPELRGRRAEPRAQIGLRTSTEMLSGRGTAILVNLSCAGAQLSGESLPGLGKDVLLTCGAIEIFGTVVWSEEERCGVSFDEPIGRAALSELRRTAWQVARSSMSDEVIQAAADWVNGLSR
jgi:hypothetical protein